MLEGSTEGAAHELRTAVVSAARVRLRDLVGWLSRRPAVRGKDHDRWLPDAHPCYILTDEGWAVDHVTTKLLLSSLTARGA